MKRTAALIYSPAIIAILIGAASIATFDSRSGSSVQSDAPSEGVPPPQGHVPNLGKITVTATRIDSSADLQRIGEKASI